MEGTVPEIGVRELKIRASEIVREVRERRARYVITHRGRPVGLLLPFSEGRAEGERTDQAAQRLRQLGREIAKGWPPGVDSGDVLSELRR
jgi:prevent-host-death family protein